MDTPQSVSESSPTHRNLYQCGTCSQSHFIEQAVRQNVTSPHGADLSIPVHTEYSDLLRRHSALHSSPGNKQALRRRHHGGKPHIAPRASQACSACADDHLKCDEDKPCARCRRRNIECVAPPKSTQNCAQLLPPNADEQAARGASNCVSESERPVEAGEEGAGETHSLVTPPVDMPTSQAWPQEVSEFHPMEPEEAPSRIHPDFISQELRDELAAASLFTEPPSGVRTPRGLITFALPTDLDLNMVDLGFLESYNSHIPFEFDGQAPSVPLAESPFEARAREAEEGTRGGTRSIQHLRWRFVPAPQDHGYCEHENLLLPTDARTSTMTPQEIDEANSSPCATEPSLDLSSRDKILGIVLSQMKHPISAVLSSFPSVQLLDSLIRYYLTAPFSSAHSWIHRGTFNPQKLCPELLLAMAAAGAVLTPDPALRKLGFAMQEVVRLQLPSVFEGNNTTIRDLHLHQAYLLYLEIGLWSGNSRKIEISEAFRQPLVTMVRRGGMFHHSAYAPLPTQLDEAGHSLSEAWHAWAYKEAYKRLVYRLFRLEAQVSMALLTAPLITYAEMSLPLPAPSSLWDARSALQWKEACNALSASASSSANARIPTLGECVADFEFLESSRRIADIRLTCGAVIHSIWGLVWEFRQLSSLLAAGSRYWDGDLLMASRHSQLRRILDCFRMAHGAEAPVQLHLVLMHMYVSVEEVEVLATSEDPSRALALDQPASALREWVGSEQARHAIWHAGQVVRAIRMLPLQTLRDLMAIALYHASLTLWAYGIVYLRVICPDRQLAVAPALGINIWLDGLETEDVHRYIALQRGVPVLQSPGDAREAVRIEDPTAVLTMMIEIMQHNHYHEVFTQTPPLVANLIHLLRRLRDVSK
ncbi:hypothetical protein AN3391.2 [Aspergillus nidulans FGSC A4]|nr:hypothetical protein AN3391.2 [Aspergillus nidulans FGSC A4]|eukprot:XP_660995.1 hypothetical protein AN3391.2 [Aspergillus nidulans FGSC A4]